jgi:hypothetical protein
MHPSPAYPSAVLSWPTTPTGLLWSRPTPTETAAAPSKKGINRLGEEPSAVRAYHAPLPALSLDETAPSPSCSALLRASAPARLARPSPFPPRSFPAPPSPRRPNGEPYGCFAPGRVNTGARTLLQRIWDGNPRVLRSAGASRTASRRCRRRRPLERGFMRSFCLRQRTERGLWRQGRGSRTPGCGPGVRRWRRRSGALQSDTHVWTESLLYSR